MPRVQNGGACAPEVVELDVPTGLRIIVPPGYGQAGGAGYENVTDVSGTHGEYSATAAACTANSIAASCM